MPRHLPRAAPYRLPHTPEGGTVFAPPLDRCYRAGRGDCLCSCGLRCEEALFTLETVNRPDNEAAFAACDGRALEQAATRRLRLSSVR